MASLDWQNLTFADMDNELWRNCTHANRCETVTRSVAVSGNDYNNPFDNPSTRAVFITLYSTVFVMAFLGNLLVLLVILKHRRMRTITNFFLANLAVADLAVAVFCVLPNLSQNIYLTWYLGRVMCKLSYFVQAMSYTASVTILIVISIERFFAILYPLRSKHLTTINLMRGVLLVAWIISAASGMPYLVIYDQVSIPSGNSNSSTEQHYCIPVRDLNMKAYVTCNFIIWYLVPLILMSVMYTKISLVLWKTSKQNNLGAACSSVTHSRYSNEPNSPKEASHCTPGSMRTTTVPFSMGHYRVISNGEDRNPVNRTKLTSSCRSNLSDNVNSNMLATNATEQLQAHGSLKDGDGLRSCSDRARGRTINLRRMDNALSQRRQVIKLLIAIILTFAICVLPYHLRMLWQTWTEPVLSSWQPLLPPITFVISYLNSGLNPVLYAFLSDKFRKSLFEILIRCRQRTPSEGSYALRTLQA